MKKFLFVLSIFFSTFLLSHKVFADTHEVNTTLSNYYRFFDYYSSIIDTPNNPIDSLITLYENDYSSDYPYYKISIESWSGSIQNPVFHLYAYDVAPTSSHPFYDFTYYYFNLSDNIQQPYNYVHVILNNNNYQTQAFSCPGSCATPNGYWQSPYFAPIIQSNFTQTLDLSDLSSYPLIEDMEQVWFPEFTSSNSDNYFLPFSVSDGAILPTYKSLLNGSYTPSVSYSTINLNDYSYVALSLRNYNQQPFNTIMQVKGQLCSTPVWNYGMTEKRFGSPTDQTQPCSNIFSNFTPVTFSIIESDLTNHAIYYLKAYDTNIDNIVKVDSNVFDITYITSSNENNPSVVIGGRSYPTIPYSELGSTATKSTDEGYISGQVNNVFDISSDSNFIENLFSNPLQALGNVWTSIITMFALVGSFIGLLPQTLQVFLYTGFNLAIVLGVIKILI